MEKLHSAAKKQWRAPRQPRDLERAQWPPVAHFVHAGVERLHIRFSCCPLVCARQVDCTFTFRLRWAVRYGEGADNFSKYLESVHTQFPQHPIWVTEFASTGDAAGERIPGFGVPWLFSQLRDCCRCNDLHDSSAQVPRRPVVD